MLSGTLLRWWAHHSWNWCTSAQTSRTGLAAPVGMNAAPGRPWCDVAQSSAKSAPGGTHRSSKRSSGSGSRSWGASSLSRSGSERPRRIESDAPRVTSVLHGRPVSSRGRGSAVSAPERTRRLPRPPSAQGLPSSKERSLSPSGSAITRRIRCGAPRGIWERPPRVTCAQGAAYAVSAQVRHGTSSTLSRMT